MSRTKPTPPEIINIHDRESFNNRLFDACRRVVIASATHPSQMAQVPAQIQAMQAAGLKAAQRKYARHCGKTSKYKPHQGAKECFRRAPDYYLNKDGG